MPDLNDFHAFKSTTSEQGSNSSRRRSGNLAQSDEGSGFGCITILVVLAILGWITKLFG